MSTRNLAPVLASALVFSLSSLAACGNDASTMDPIQDDSGGGSDGTSSDIDAGGGVDGGSTFDAGGGQDGTTGNDGGRTSDSGGTSDGGGTDSGGTTDSGGGGTDASVVAIQNVFIIMMENHSWADIQGSASAPYINNTLVPMGAHAEQYFTPPGNHPSEPNYIWLEAGDNLGITDDNEPSVNHQATTNHLVTMLRTANVAWKSYVEDIAADTCPTTSSGLYAAKHTPFVFFDDVTSDAAYCKSHIRPFTELAGDLTNNAVARYNFISPNLCDDMHGTTGGFQCVPILTDLIKKGDDWLKVNIPVIMASQAYANGGVIFVAWDEGSGTGSAADGPIPLLVLSSKAKTGYASQAHFTHSSMVKSVQEILGVTPLLRHAGDANTSDLADLFTSFP